MLKDITIGQYYPAESVIHRLDARVKTLLTILFIVIIFFITNFWGYLALGVFVLGIIGLSRVPVGFFLRGLRPMLIFIIFTAAINIFMTPGEVIWSWWKLSVTVEGLHYAAFMILRIIFLVCGSSLLTYTTSPISLTNGLESLMSPLAKIKFPAHEIAMMMTIALRMIPTLMEETDKIMKAQQARCADFESGNLIRRAKALIPILVPLFISAFRRADELAIAMETRCYTGGKGRTSLHKPKLAFRDFMASVLLIVVGVGIWMVGR